MVTDCQSEKRLYVRFSCKVTQKDWNRTQNAHAFLFNFREFMSKMREFVYFETIFVNSATPAWAKAAFPTKLRPLLPLCRKSPSLSQQTKQEIG